MLDDLRIQSGRNRLSGSRVSDRFGVAGGAAGLQYRLDQAGEAEWTAAFRTWGESRGRAAQGERRGGWGTRWGGMLRFVAADARRAFAGHEGGG